MPSVHTHHLVQAAIAVVYPPPRTHALSVRTRRHIGRDFEYGVTVPDTPGLDGKDDHVLWTDLFGIVGVSDREGTASEVVRATSVEV